MKSVIYLGPGGRELWRRETKGWRPIESLAEDHVWVVTDLPEESFSEARAPRLMGRDRISFVERQLAGRYPDTVYRGSITAARGGDLVERLIPTRHVLFGIDAAQRLDAELDSLAVPVAGVWPMSMLLASLGQDRSLPPDLFVVLPGPGTLRIVFLKDRTPALTRLTLTANEPKAQVDEIIRTLRHLENTQGIPRGQEHPVLLLADAAGYEAPMAASRLTLVQVAKLAKDVPVDWRLPLFDLALQSVPGQVAPLARRVSHLAARLGRAAKYMAVVIALVGVAAAAGNLGTILSLAGQKQAIAESVADIGARAAGVDVEIARYGVSPELVRSAIGIYQREIASAPDFEDSLRLVAAAIETDPSLRLTDLQTRILAPSGSTCGVDLASEDGSQRPEAKHPEVAKRRVEIAFDIVVPATYGPRDRAQTVRMISSKLGTIEGMMLWIDANKDLASGSLRGGTVVGAVTRLGWCFTVPGVLPERTGQAEVPRS